MRRWLAAIVVGLFVATWFGLPSTSTADPPPAGGEKLDPNDPLLKALEALQRDVAGLRSELEGKPAANAPQPSMAAPAMSKPPAMGAAPRPQSTVVQKPVALAPAAKTSDHWAFQP